MILKGLSARAGSGRTSLVRSVVTSAPKPRELQQGGVLARVPPSHSSKGGGGPRGAAAGCPPSIIPDTTELAVTWRLDPPGFVVSL